MDILKSLLGVTGKQGYAQNADYYPCHAHFDRDDKQLGSNRV